MYSLHYNEDIYVKKKLYIGTTSWGNKELLIMLLVVLIVIGRRFETMIRWPPSIASSGESLRGGKMRIRAYIGQDRD